MSKSNKTHFVSKQAQVKMSKKLSSALRHQAVSMHLTISPDGFVAVRELLAHSQFRGHSMAQLEECVALCAKQRFQLKTDDNGDVFIRATQGHSISSVKDEELLELIQDPASIPVCLHGTYAKCIPSIMKTGLNRMRRNNIHLIACLPSEEDGVVSGMRGSADTIVTIDVAGAMAAGIPFYRSSNGVILSPGLGDTGCIPAEFISQVLARGAAHKGHGTKQPQPQPQLPPPPPVNIVDTINVVDTITKPEADGLQQCDFSAFTHYCVVDFEATCLDKQQIFPQEIIEFPAVMLSATTLEVVTEFHSYVRPVHHPILSDFCTELTGITQDIVDGAPTFSIVYQNFIEFLEKFSTQYREDHEGQECNVLFSTHGDWDFKTMLPSQCKTSALQVPEGLTRWMNVKELYINSKEPGTRQGGGGKKRKGRLGMEAMLAQLGLELIGRHHSGIDDTRNIARIVVELISNRGAVPMVTANLYEKNKNSKNMKVAKHMNNHYSRSQQSQAKTQHQSSGGKKYTFT